ncbi:hypothetical protein ACFW04_013766 [Cataglyphis niger]
MMQKQWKILRDQFTRERLENIYEPSGTENDTSKRPRKTWYLYHSLLFLAPYIAHRSTSSNFTLQSASQSASESSFNNLWNPKLFGDGSNVSSPLSERSMYSESLATSASSVRISSQEQKQLSKMIGNTTETINILMHSLIEKRSHPVSNDNEEEAAMVKAIIYALRRVNFKYKIQCYMECLSILDKYQNLTAMETVQNL